MTDRLPTSNVQINVNAWQCIVCCTPNSLKRRFDILEFGPQLTHLSASDFTFSLVAATSHRVTAHRSPLKALKKGTCA